MKGLKYLFLVVALLVGLFVGVGLILPSSFNVERFIDISATPKNIFSLIGDHEESLKWSPWAAKDPEMTVDFEKGTSGEDATMHWKSNNPDVGQGSSTFVEYVANKKVTLALDFGEIMTTTAEINLNDLGGNKGTQVIWTLEAKHNSLISRYLGIFMGDLVGRDLEVGLQNLKREAEALPSIKTEEIKYSLDGTEYTGYFAYPDNNKQNPSVIIVHEWWGHNDYARKRADMLAELGYAALALDMYGDGKLAQHPEEAKAFMMEVIEASGAAEARFDSALALLKNQPFVDPANIAAIGYCFGGAVVLNMARLGKDLNGVVSYHGGLSGLMPISDGGNNPPALVFNGADDPFVKPEAIEAFRAEMDAAEFEYEFVNLAGAKHSFTNPGADAFGKKFNLPLEYNAEADKKSWARTQAFFVEIFQ